MAREGSGGQRRGSPAAALMGTASLIGARAATGMVEVRRCHGTVAAASVAVVDPWTTPLRRAPKDARCAAPVRASVRCSACAALRAVLCLRQCGPSSASGACARALGRASHQATHICSARSRRTLSLHIKPHRACRRLSAETQLLNRMRRPASAASRVCLPSLTPLPSSSFSSSSALRPPCLLVAQVCRTSRSRTTR